MWGPHLKGELEFDEERKVDRLQDALFVQGVFNLFQLYHLQGWEGRAKRTAWERVLLIPPMPGSGGAWAVLVPLSARGLWSLEGLPVPAWHVVQGKNRSPQAFWIRGVRAMLGEARGLWMPR